MTDYDRLKETVAGFPRPQIALASVLAELHQMSSKEYPGNLTDLAAKLCHVSPNDAASIYANSPAFSKPKMKVCTGLTCMLYGAQEVATCLQRMGGTTTTTSCLGYCHTAPVVQDKDGSFYQANLHEDWMALQKGEFEV